MNILVLICDELRYDALECNGNPYVHTPNLNLLAARSVRFANAYTSAPVCSPARHSMISGIYPGSHGVLNNGMKPGEGFVSIADKLEPYGYRNAQFGAVPNNNNTTYGFEPAELLDKEPFLSEWSKKFSDWEHYHITRRGTAGPSPKVKEEYKGYLAAGKAIDLLSDAVAKGEKFHFWIGLPEPHPPWYPPKENYAKFDQSRFKLPDEVPASAAAPHPTVTEKQKEWSHLTDVEKRQMLAGYYGLVELVDGFVGMVLDTIDRLNIADDTMIIFTADHGEQMGDHNLYTKFVMREPSVHVPLMVYHPELAPGDRNQLVAHVDLFPTICDYAGAPVPEGIHGRSLRPILENGEAADSVHEEVVAQIGTHVMIRTEEWKLNVYDGEPGELYHVDRDPKEHYNLIGDSKYTDVVAQLHTRLKTRYQTQ